MKKTRKNKGFTLIELLAVIIILAVIALVSTPVVLDVIDDARRDSFKSSIDGIIDGIEYEIIDNLLTLQETKENAKTYYFPNTNLNITGQEPTGGYVKVSKEMDSTVLAYNDSYCAIKGLNEIEVTVSEFKDSECEEYANNTYGFGFDEETGTITSYDESYGTDVVIPYSINGVVVKNIGDSAFSGEYDEEIVIIYDNTTGVCASLYELSGLGCPYMFKKSYAIENDMDYKYIYKVKTTENTKRICQNMYTGSTDEIQDDITVGISSGYVACLYTGISYAEGTITSIDFSNATELEKIGHSSFFKQQISNIIFGNNTKLKEIGVNAFNGNKITTLDLSKVKELKVIDDLAFFNNKISIINFDNPALEQIKMEAFAKNNLNYLDLSSVTNLKEIGMRTFGNNNLKTINIGSSKELDINATAFRKENDSNSNLTTIVNNTGNSYDWSSITIYSDTNNSSGNIFETGVIIHPYGNITVIKD